MTQDPVCLFSPACLSLAFHGDKASSVPGILCKAQSQEVQTSQTTWAGMRKEEVGGKACYNAQDERPGSLLLVSFSCFSNQTKVVFRKSALSFSEGLKPF